MKIELSHDIELELLDTTYNITYRELSDKEKKAVDAKYDESVKLSDKVELLVNKKMLESEKLTAYKMTKNPKKVLKTIAKLEALNIEQEALEAKFEDLGGSGILFTLQRDRFDSCIGGKDKDALVAVIEEKASFEFILDLVKKNINPESADQLSE